MGQWIEGFDISHWNGKDMVSNTKKKYPEMKFVVIKCTEGIKFRDNMCLENALAAKEHGMVYGLYHFANANKNSAREEAVHFCSTVEQIVREVGKMPFLALDWEGDSTKMGAGWAHEFVNKVYQITGCKPMIYCSASQVQKIGALKAADCGIWIARWNSMMPNPAPWDVVTMWQYTDTPFDRDKFNGSVEQLQKYCIQRTWYEVEEENASGGCYCGCTCCGR